MSLPNTSPEPPPSPPPSPPLPNGFLDFTVVEASFLDSVALVLLLSPVSTVDLASSLVIIFSVCSSGFGVILSLEGVPEPPPELPPSITNFSSFSSSGKLSSVTTG